MKNLILFILSTLLASPANADEKVNKTVDAKANGTVEISNVAGSVEVSGWSRNSVQVTGTIGPNVTELIVEREGNTVVVKVKVPKRGGRGINSDLIIKVPEKSSLDIGTVSAEIEVAGVSGELSLAAVSGNITADVTGADVSAESVSGNVELKGKGAKGDVEASSVSGNVIVDGLMGSAELESVSGNLRARGSSFDEADFETVTGNIDFNGKLPKGGEMSVESVNGDVDLDFDGKVSAEIDISTFNGRIRNCFGPKAQKTSKYGPGWELEFTAGGGDGDIEISTLNGGVSICDE